MARGFRPRALYRAACKLFLQTEAKMVEFKCPSMILLFIMSPLLFDFRGDMMLRLSFNFKDRKEIDTLIWCK